MAEDVSRTPPAEEHGEEVSWEDAFQEAGAGPGGAAEAPPATPERTARPNGTARRTPAGTVDLDFLLDISLSVTAEIGRTKLLVSDLLQLNQGSLIPLDKQVGESLDILVNGKLMARGEVVTVNEMFAIRLTEIIGPKERIQQLV
jgi:flagellar motor switch protein FliN/FliY